MEQVRETPGGEWPGSSRREGPRLLLERSPYLLQHARDCVDWYPWGEEAFERAGKEGKPVFLSIGYSSCRWCHVMERESFMDPQVGDFLNANFVCVKVDREERPDLDEVYMGACRLLAGTGGWPLNLFLTPRGEPIHAALYLPKKGRPGAPGLLETAEALKLSWERDRKALEKGARRIVEALRDGAAFPLGPKPCPEVLGRACLRLREAFDPEFGGFGPGPKFPMVPTLDFLLDFYESTGERGALEMVVRTLHGMRAGGIFDQLGGGFHRYAVDRAWEVPHFEKMLYDQALCARIYCRAFQATGEEAFKETALLVLESMKREFAAPGGGFFSSLDAESGEEEGLFYRWSRKEVEEVLGREEGAFFLSAFPLPPGEEKWVLSLREFPETLARKAGITPAETRRRLERAIEALRAARDRRKPPFLDDKILTDWNGLALSALALGARTLGRPDFLDLAEETAAFLQEKARGPGGRLYHLHRRGESWVPGFLSDYAFFVQGLLDLHGVTGEEKYLDRAEEIALCGEELFGDPRGGGCFLVGRDQPEPLYRHKPFYDGALPSGNGVALANDFRLFLAGRGEAWLQRGLLGLRAFYTPLVQGPHGSPGLLAALLVYQSLSPSSLEA